MLPIKSSTWHHITKFRNQPVLKRKKKKKLKERKKRETGHSFSPIQCPISTAEHWNFQCVLLVFPQSTKLTWTTWFLTCIRFSVCKYTHSSMWWPCWTKLNLAFGRYHWRELPQVSFLSQQKFCFDKHVFCCNKSMLATTKVFVETKTLSVVTKLCLSRQTRVCHEENFVVTSILLLQQKTCFVVTNTCLSQQTRLSWQNFCRNKNDTCGSSCLTFNTDIYSRHNKGTSGIDWKWCLCVHKIYSFVVFL